MSEPTTRAGRWLAAKSNWDAGMRGFFVRINLTAGPEDMLVHVLAIEAEARQQERERIAAAAVPRPEGLDGIDVAAWYEAFASINGSEAATSAGRLDLFRQFRDAYLVAWGRRMMTAPAVGLSDTGDTPEEPTDV